MKYNQKQIKAISSNDEEIIVIAPAGSGKTSTLVGAIMEYKNSNPKDFLVAITFTRKASEELKERLKSYSGIQVSTIHSWAYQELERLSIILMKEDPNNSFKVKVLEESKMKEILKELCQRARYQYVNVGVLYSYITGNYNMDISQGLKSKFQRILKDYKDYKKRYGIYDFMDLPQYLLDKLNDYNRNIENIDALFVDEVQDVDDIQLELFNRTPTKKKFLIGDPKQSIYIFRGATQEVLDKLNHFNLYPLEINYRSYQEIIDYATTYNTESQVYPTPFSGIIESYPSDIKCIRGQGGFVGVLLKNGKITEVNSYEIIDGESIFNKILNENYYILCRTNKEVKLIKELGNYNVQTIHQAKGLEYKNVVLTEFDTSEEEDRNIAYVGMTRAKDRLVLSNFTVLYNFLKNKKRTNVSKLF